MNFASMGIKELNALKRSVDKEIDRRQNTERKKAIDELRAFAKARGLTLEDLRGDKKPGRKKIAKTDQPEKKAGPKRGPAKIKYRHPEQTKLTWTGRGRQPKWVVEWLADGKAIEALSV